MKERVVDGWMSLVKTIALVTGVDMLYGNNPIGEDKLTRKTNTWKNTRDLGLIRRRGIKTPVGTPPIDEAAQASWDFAKVPGGKTYELNMTREVTRRKRQIATGQLTRSNGLVWLSQLASRMWKKGTGTGLFLRKPYFL